VSAAAPASGHAIFPVPRHARQGHVPLPDPPHDLHCDFIVPAHAWHFSLPPEQTWHFTRLPPTYVT
jgi:hypothetical protein